MEQANDGGTAFPVSEEAARGKVAGVYGGMSLRDYFAAKAMVGVHAEYMGFAKGSPLTRDDYHNIAADSFTLADAMLKARQS